jgi:hypothetical protein
MQEWISVVSDYVFSQRDCWLPCEYDTRTFVFNPANTNTRVYHLAGKLHALALLTRTKMTYCLAPHLLRFLMSDGVHLSWTDLQYVSIDNYKSIAAMLACEDVSVLEQMFVVASDVAGAPDIELIPGGAERALTNDNKLEFAEAFARNRLLGSQGAHLTDFLAAFQSLMRANTFPHRLLSNRELVTYLCGDVDVNVTLLRQLATYEGYTVDSPQVTWFWEIVEQELSELQRKALLFFTTSSSQMRAHANPVFRIQTGAAHDDGKALPTAQTCFRTLLLPKYVTKAAMRDRLVWLLSCPSRYQSFGNI